MCHKKSALTVQNQDKLQENLQDFIFCQNATYTHIQNNNNDDITNNKYEDQKAKQL